MASQGFRITLTISVWRLLIIVVITDKRNVYYETNDTWRLAFSIASKSFNEAQT